MQPGTAAALEALGARSSGASRHVVIIGGGIAGLTLAWALARAGQRVSLFDAAPLPNPRGSSFDDGRIIRHVYGPLEGYAAMMPAAHRAWAALFSDTGVDRLVPARALYVLREEGPWQAAAARALAAAGLPMTILDEAALAAVPMLNREGILRVVEVGGSGILRAGAILDDLLALLPRLGVVLRGETRVAAIDGETGTIRLVDGTAVSADVIVVAAGTEAGQLLPDAARATGLRASVQTLAYLAPPAARAPSWAEGPMLLCRLPGHAAGGVYILPPREGAPLKIGDYDTGTDAEPEQDHAALRADRAAALLDAGARAIAGFGDYRILRMRHCAYTMAPGDRFVVHRAGQRAWLLSACSGHGFKLAPLIALGLAAAILGRLDDCALSTWAAGREAEVDDA
ncbi:MAG: FAD-dependent oxidoreductase [Acetobacteraceae bacterium]|nr:FAD-dependent oxidoreductase [Acetobacteraceae bacterium]